MRISAQKTAIAKLRNILEMRIDEFARRLGVSGDLVKKMEAGQRAVTESTAAAAESEFGVSRKWMLAGVPKSPIDFWGKPFSKERSNEIRAQNKKGDPLQVVRVDVVNSYAPNLAAVARCAAANNRLTSFMVDAENAITALRSKYGFDALEYVEASRITAKAPVCISSNDQIRKPITTEPFYKKRAIAGPAAVKLPSSKRPSTRKTGKV